MLEYDIPGRTGSFLYGFKLLGLCLCEGVVPYWCEVFKYRSCDCNIEMDEVVWRESCSFKLFFGERRRLFALIRRSVAVDLLCLGPSLHVDLADIKTQVLTNHDHILATLLTDKIDSHYYYPQICAPQQPAAYSTVLARKMHDSNFIVDLVHMLYRHCYWLVLTRFYVQSCVFQLLL